MDPYPGERTPRQTQQYNNNNTTNTTHNHT